MEGITGARFVAARNRLSPEIGAEWIEVAGAYAIFDGPESPLTQTFGLGLFAEPTTATWIGLRVFSRNAALPFTTK